MAPSLVIHSVAAFAKALLRFGCRDVQVNGLDNFLKVLQDQKRRDEGRGILTYCNHISVMDEPTIWGALPWWTFRSPSTTRWTLGASDIMFTNDALRRFFTAGQVIETHRGGGIFQPSIDTAISKLDAGQWIHLFPEGYVNVGTTTKLRRFKWGLSRMILEAQQTPVVVPIWITGFDRLMPEPRSWPKFLPRLGASVSITFGEPVQDRLSALLSGDGGGGSEGIDDTLRCHDSERAVAMIASSSYPTLSPTSRGYASLRTETVEAAQRRSDMAAMLRYEMAQLGRRVRILNGQDPDTEVPLVHTATLIPHTKTGIVSDPAADARGPTTSKEGLGSTVERKVKSGLGKHVPRQQAEQGWKDSAT
ncbi:uncharacterized protein PFL1_03482 [Pseudozyma flocculosa PF-1]|uniref:Tafazzin family protein n=2 Tax=Pseudozyma flocculosa TaxID=84751 RepID=A0A5C3FAL7_9BASI|nr:uncharacterized protein PFL1_03482 [Pseudozyma flocculosa PF-1]EPQ29195.1 hypothetical protein PFL1_03482 [Pseudozyma flocculosa PF-1]SPO41504.1 related to TAZ1 - Lyso-phosphatidylcholine acyltransferase [Pseudozyma flocculosa]